MNATSRGRYRNVADRLLASAPVSVPYTALTSRRLRILTYHGIEEPEPFGEQIGWLSRHFQPVEVADVVAAAEGRVELPDRVVWVTFDDGHPEVVEIAQPVLDRHAVRATVFVIPALIDTEQPFWWQVFDQALDLGLEIRVDGRTWTTRDVVTRLKTVPDRARREALALVEEEIARVGDDVRRRQLSSDALRGWIGQGHSVGNHTFDHPCLDRCEPEEQAREIEEADRWLAAFQPGAPRSFAYPNGNWDPVAERVLAQLGYSVAVLNDHRLARPSDNPLRMSRLRVSSSTPMPRFRSIVASASPVVLGMLGRRPRRPRA